MPKKYLLLATSALIAGGALIWFFTDSNSEAPKLADQRFPLAESKARDTALVPASGIPTTPSRAHRSERESKDSAGRLEQLEEFTDSLKDKVVVDLGTVEDIGKKTATMLGFQKELLQLRSIKPQERTPEENQRLLELERQNATAMGILPEITDFQNDPAQYAQFFASLIQEAAGLDQNQQNVVHDYMRGRGEGLIAAGLNAANEPIDPSEEAVWENRRDQFNSQTAAGVAQLLAPGEAERIGFTPGFLELLEQDFDKVDVNP